MYMKSFSLPHFSNEMDVLGYRLLCPVFQNLKECYIRIITGSIQVA